MSTNQTLGHAEAHGAEKAHDPMPEQSLASPVDVRDPRDARDARADSRPASIPGGRPAPRENPWMARRVPIAIAVVLVLLALVII